MPTTPDQRTDRYVFDIDGPPAGSAEDRNRLLGGKGANLAVMAVDLGLPVPPGFTITTEACRSFLSGAWPDELDEELGEHMARLGERLGRAFGDPADPLLVSVRSGAPVSMPGMMDTVLNLGLSPTSVEGLAAAIGDRAFADDCLHRFLDSYREVIGSGDVPDDPWAQLRAAIEAVFRSWNSERARAYRRREGIPDDLGTAVTVQAMVFGNRGADSGTGVLFTRNPSTGEAVPYGDVMFDAQGEDVVAGGHEPEPIVALDERLPEVAAELREHAYRLEHHYADLCDIEFTVESARLWLLQVRAGKRSPRAALRMAIEMAEDPSFPLSREDAVRRVAGLLVDPPQVFRRADAAVEPIATGLPASPGVATGGIVTSSDAAEEAGSAGRDVILVRSETSPEDVRGMAQSVGILTSRGGLASHAAVVARGWGIPAVVGASAVALRDDRVEIGDRSLAIGDEITIDGGTGEVFAGALQGHHEVTPEAATLLGWADELGMELSAATDAPGEPEAEVPAGGALPPPEPDDLLRALLVRGAAAPEQLAEMLLVEVATLDPLLGPTVVDGSVERTADTVRLTSGGKLAAADLFAVDRERIGAERSGELLEAFHEVDLEMKEIVTAWQVREVDGEQALNDHTDADYDASILDRLAALHERTVALAAPLADAFRRHAAYRERLAGALERARAGDVRWVASPRLDSYHSVWFELHEDLIRLAGRRRADEAAAGRA